MTSHALGDERSADPQAMEEYAAWQAFIHQDPYILKAVALDTNADFTMRVGAIEMLAKDPASHLDALETLLVDPSPDLRWEAIKAIEPIRPDIAYQELKTLYGALLVQNQKVPRTSVNYFLLSVAELLARLGDGSAFPFITRQLLESPSRTTQVSAISALSSFFYMKELEIYKPLVLLVDKTLPDLASLNVRDGEHTPEDVLTRAFYELSGLHAVETIPDFKRWLADPRTVPVRDALEYNLRDLEAIQARLDAGEPDKRDAIKIVPGTAPAWKLPKAVRD